MARGKGVFVPQWVVWVLIGAGLLWLTLKLLIPPSHMVKRLDSPDGEWTAQLMRTQYAKDHFKVMVRSGWLWHTAFYSEPITNDFRTDLGERLKWSDDSSRLYFYLRGRAVWGYDFDDERRLTPKELRNAPAATPRWNDSP